jgi:predicted ribosomally synthesized peptide with SipW-like signal peptide
VLALLAGACVAVLGGTSAWAYWTASASTNATVPADSLPEGTTPTTSLSGPTVTVSFADATTTQGHVAATGYLVRRYDAAAGGAATTLDCTASPCTDTPGKGTWYYTNTPLLGTHWQGTESARVGQTVAFGPAAKLAFTTQPSSPTAPNTSFAAQPAVTIQDAAGNTVTSATNGVALALTTPAGANLSCGANPLNAVSGVATFSGCKVDKAGTYTLTATASGLTGATSAQFSIGTSTPTITSPTTSAPFTVQPHNASKVTVAVTGTGFQAGAVVSIAGSDNVFTINSYTVNSSTSITVVVSAQGGTGKLDGLTVTNPDGGSVTMPRCLKNS